MPEEQPTPSLIQQRMALSRRRSLGSVVFVVFGILLVSDVLRLAADFTGAAWWLWTGTACHLLIAVYGVVLYMSALSRLRAFESRHGRDPGRQRSVT